VRIWCSACNRIDGPLLISGAGADTGAVAVKYSSKRTMFWQTYPDVCRQTRPTWLVGLDTRPPSFGGTTRGPTLHPTFAVRRDSRIEWGHRSSASRSRILKRFFPLLVSPHLRPQNLLLWLPSTAVLKQVASRLCLVAAPPELRRVRVLRPFQVLSSAAGPVLG